MPEVEMDEETYERLLVTSRLLDKPIGEVIGMLVNRLTAEPQPTQRHTASAPAPETTPVTAQHEEKPMPTMTDEWLAIHKIYKGHRIEGTFNPNTHEVRLSTAPWTNKYFASPTAAAVVVVEHYSSDVRETNNTNGRKFWKVTSTGENLRSIIGVR